MVCPRCGARGSPSQAQPCTKCGWPRFDLRALYRLGGTFRQHESEELAVRLENESLNGLHTVTLALSARPPDAFTSGSLDSLDLIELAPGATWTPDWNLRPQYGGKVSIEVGLTFVDTEATPWEFQGKIPVRIRAAEPAAHTSYVTQVNEININQASDTSLRSPNTVAVGGAAEVPEVPPSDSGAAGEKSLPWEPLPLELTSRSQPQTATGTETAFGRELASDPGLALRPDPERESDTKAVTELATAPNAECEGRPRAEPEPGRRPVPPLAPQPPPEPPHRAPTFTPSAASREPPRRGRVEKEPPSASLLEPRPGPTEPGRRGSPPTPAHMSAAAIVGGAVIVALLVLALLQGPRFLAWMQGTTERSQDVPAAAGHQEAVGETGSARGADAP